VIFGNPLDGLFQVFAFGLNIVYSKYPFLPLKTTISAHRFQRSDGRGQMAEVRRQRTEDRGQMTEDGGQKAEDRRQNYRGQRSDEPP
jgi:hypothetical protein